jgi:ribonucleoside-diphosphate reductase alpha chain
MQGGADITSPSPAGGGSAGETGRGGASNVTALNASSPRGEIAGSTALKAEPEQKLSPTEKLEHLQWTKPEARAEAKAVAAERRAEAKAKGYEGEMCGECLNFTLVRNGTCLKCETCGSTTGCS